MTYLRFDAAALLALATLSTLGCQKLTSVKVDPTTATLQALDETTALQVQQLDKDGKPMKKDAPVTWSSSDGAVVAVKPGGRVMALKSGEASITAKVGSLEAQAKVVVQIATKVTGGQDLLFTGVGQNQTLKLQAADESGQVFDDITAKMKVMVPDPKVATVAGAEGGPWIVTATGPGQTRLIAKAGKLSQTYTIAVKPPQITGIKLDPLSMRLKIGESQKLVATALSGDQPIPGPDPSFTSSAPGVATIDSSGIVHAVSKGKANIAVTMGSKQGTVAITVWR